MEMTTLSGGLYAQSWNRKQTPTEKHWPPTNPNKKALNSHCNDIQKFNTQQRLRYWLIHCKHCGSEYLEDD